MSRAEVPKSAYRERGPRGAPKLTFEDALDTLQSMFQGWSRSSLAEMLQANQLNMELTIESILAIGAPPASFGDGGENESASDSGLPDSMDDTTESDGQMARRLSEQWNGTDNTTPLSPAASSQHESGGGASSGRGHAITLPEDFLRVPGSKHLSVSQQMELDEQLARMLQDERFLRELREMPEFERYARGGEGRGGGASQGYPDSSSSNHHHGRSSSALSSSIGSSSSSNSSHDDGLAAIKKGIGEMGDTMKRKVNAMYMRFLRAREGRRGDNSHVPLMDDRGDDEGEVVLFNSSSSSSDRRRAGGNSSSSSIPLRSPTGVELGDMRGGGSNNTRDDDGEEVLFSAPSKGQRLV